MDEKEYNVIFIDKNEKIIFETVLDEYDTDKIMQNFYENRNIGRIGNSEFKVTIKTSEVAKIIAEETHRIRGKRRITIRFTNGEEIHFTDDNLLYTFEVVLDDYESDNKVLRIEMQNRQDIILNKNTILYINVCEV